MDLVESCEEDKLRVQNGFIMLSLKASEDLCNDSPCFCLHICSLVLSDTFRIHAVECRHAAHGAHELLITVSDIAVTADWSAGSRSSILTGSHGWGCMAVPTAAETHRFNADDSDSSESKGAKTPVAAPFYYLIKVTLQVLVM
jgi:hypothetical protein